MKARGGQNMRSARQHSLFLQHQMVFGSSDGAAFSRHLLLAFSSLMFAPRCLARMPFNVKVFQASCLERSVFDTLSDALSFVWRCCINVRALRAHSRASCCAVAVCCAITRGICARVALRRFLVNIRRLPTDAVTRLTVL